MSREAVGDVEQVLGQLVLPVKRLGELGVVVVDVVIEVGQGQGDVLPVPRLEVLLHGGERVN